MIRPPKISVLSLAVMLFVLCAVAVVAVDCGGDLGCAASKFALGYFLIGLVVVFAGAAVWSFQISVSPLVLPQISLFPSISVSLTTLVRAPPALL
jgi:hypothetical protein